jgi:hypothetical protein
MAIKLIKSYQVWWDSSAGVGYFWFTYSDGERQRTGIVAQDSFRIVIDILRNEKRVYGDHLRTMVTTQSGEVGEEVD